MLFIKTIDTGVLHGLFQFHYSTFLCRYTYFLVKRCLERTYYHLKRQSQLLSSALSSASYFKSHFCKQCGPRSDCPFRSSLIWVHTVCLYAKIGLKKFARIFSRRQKQTTFSYADVFGVLRVNSFGAKFQTTLVVCFFFYKLSTGKKLICKTKRLNAKQRRS